jgi:hypothetical protein
MSEPDDVPFGKNDHAKHCPEHSGAKGHYCREWDGLYICEDCHEFKTACYCFPKSNTEKSP